jgi:hypothetical protein
MPRQHSQPGNFPYNAARGSRLEVRVESFTMGRLLLAQVVIKGPFGVRSAGRARLLCLG